MGDPGGESGVDVEAVADAELAGLDPYDALDAEAARVSSFLHGLDDEGWAVPTRCDGWDRRALAAHLAAVEEYHRACLDDTLGELFERGAAAGVTDLHTFNDWGVRSRADRSAADVVAEWETANASTRRDIRARDGGTMATSVGQYPVRWQAFHIASELATHADDLGVPVREEDRSGRLAWRVPFSRFALAEVRGRVDVDLDAVDDEELVEGAAGRLPSDHPLAAVLSTMP
jgi:uncharacterized protein (TIGR03083 family)